MAEAIIYVTGFVVQTIIYGLLSVSTALHILKLVLAEG